MKQHLICILIFLTWFVKSTTAQDLNLGMEEVNAYAQPDVWRLGHTPGQPIVYRLLSDSVVKHSGLYSLKIFSNSDRAKFGSCYIQIPLQVPGKTITLKGFLKTDNIQNGFGSLFLTLNNDTVTVDYANFEKMGIVFSGTHEWQEFSISLPSPKDVTKLSFGAFLVGTGILWVDDLTLLVDDTKIEKSPTLNPEYKDPKTGKVKKF